ncbi:MAG: transcription termination/antitermination NusG family protein [Acidobacteriota bacterium]
MGGEAGVEPEETVCPLPEVAEWAVAWTKARAEKTFVKYLDGLGVKSYLPLARKRRVYGRHIRQSLLPLFPGYVFYDATGIDRRGVFESRKVAQILRTEEQERLKEELASLSLALAQQPLLHNVPFDVSGTPVRVVGGPFKDVRGEFIRRKKGDMLVVKITLLQRAVEMEIDEAYVERV